jgi:SAM-dependent methyltransferase
LDPNDANAPEDFAAWSGKLRASYDSVADEYAAHIYDELRHKPLDRELLDRLATRVGGLGPICDLGCGPGQVARYLRDQGAAAFGVDLSEGMLAQARRLNPDLEFRQGDMLALSDPAESWGGAAAFYSLIHIPRERVPHALAELRRVLRPGGFVLIAVHSGEETVHRDELWGRPVSIDFIFYEPQVLERLLSAAGFVVDEVIVREPYPEVEVATRRAYVMAHKPEYLPTTR